MAQEIQNKEGPRKGGSYVKQKDGKEVLKHRTKPQPTAQEKADEKTKEAKTTEGDK